MTYKDFCEDSEIEYTLFVTINGEHSVKLQAYDLDGLIEQTNKIYPLIDETLRTQFMDKPDYSSASEEWEHNLDKLESEEENRLNNPLED